MTFSSDSVRRFLRLSRSLAGGGTARDDILTVTGTVGSLRGAEAPREAAGRTGFPSGVGEWGRLTGV